MSTMVSKRADERSKAIMKTAVATKNLENPKLKKRKRKKKKQNGPLSYPEKYPRKDMTRPNTLAAMVVTFQF